MSGVETGAGVGIVALRAFGGRRADGLGAAPAFLAGVGLGVAMGLALACTAGALCFGAAWMGVALLESGVLAAGVLGPGRLLVEALGAGFFAAALAGLAVRAAGAFARAGVLVRTGVLARAETLPFIGVFAFAAGRFAALVGALAAVRDLATGLNGAFTLAAVFFAAGRAAAFDFTETGFLTGLAALFGFAAAFGLTLGAGFAAAFLPLAGALAAAATLVTRCF